MTRQQHIYRIWGTRGTYRALDGTTAVHTPKDSPYYYDKFAVYQNGWKDTDKHIHSKDVLINRHYETYSMRLFHDKSQSFTGRDPELIQVLLSMVIGEPVILTGIEEENHDNGGYPYWLFYYRKPPHETGIRMKADFYDTMLERDKTYMEDMEKERTLFGSLFSDMKI